MITLCLEYDVYQFFTSSKIIESSDKSILIKEGRFRKKYLHFFKVEEERFEDGSSYDKYLLAKKDSSFSRNIDDLKLIELPHQENLKASLLTSFPLIIILSDSSELRAYSADKSNLELIK
ncbi:conserved hypothetical protein [Listeria seeligeri FSL S4-171]|uniref:hypothetical protein n=1 Tax=Listeria seeligeri TaxID=1640 RepID=UPI0001EB7E08|nr:hypothetical protein [Listeria seeligeri]EFS04333.1 conserved hypothetical protein [Listeria seeligeri FSL S4-171]